MATEKPRFSLTMDEEMVKNVEEYQNRKGLSTKSKAIQELVESGLAALNEAGELSEMEKSPDPAAAGPRDQDEMDFMRYVGELTKDQQELLAVLLRAMIEQNRRGISGSPAEADGTTKES